MMRTFVRIGFDALSEGTQMVATVPVVLGPDVLAGLPGEYCESLRCDPGLNRSIAHSARYAGEAVANGKAENLNVFSTGSSGSASKRRAFAIAVAEPVNETCFFSTAMARPT